MIELLRAVAAALPDFATAFLFFATWLRPDWLGRDWVRHLMLVMLVEFLVVHSFGFMFGAAEEFRGDALGATMAILGFGVFYLLFAAAFAAAFKSWWPVIAIGWLIGTKVWSVIVGGESEAERTRVQLAWAASTALYLFGAFFTSLLPLPKFGVTGHLRDYGMKGDATGVWVEQPYRVIAFGAMYFSGMGVTRFLLALG